jgi:hypothetical protein
MGPLMMAIFGAGSLIVPFDRRRRAKKDVYLLTNQRAVVFTKTFWSRKKDVYTPTQLTQMRTLPAWTRKGAGDLIFKTVITITTTTTTRRSRHGMGRSSTSTNITETHYGFLAVDDYKKVDKLVRETLVDKVLDKLAELNQMDD